MSNSGYTPDKASWTVMERAAPLGDEVLKKEIIADEKALGMVKVQLGLEDIQNLKASFSFEKINGYVVHIQGSVSADIVQNCVVTLDPIHSHIKEEVEGWFADPAEVIGFDKVRKQKEMETEDGEVPIMDEKDDPEPLVNGCVDLGDLAVQFLSLGIDPYPHKEGVAHEFTDEDHARIEKERMQDNPFAALKDWKEKPKG